MARRGLEHDEAWDAKEYKAWTRETWDASAAAYIPFAARYLEPYGRELLRMLKTPRRGRLLDIACGAGEPAITLAKRMGPRVEAVGCDLSPKMVELANRQARRRGARGVRFQVEDAEHLSFASGAFDVVTCRFGLQIFTDPEGALAEMRRVLKPGGRLGIAVWGLSWRTALNDILIGAMIRNTAQPEYIPTPYEFGNVKELRRAVEGAGFRAVKDKRVVVDLTADSPQQYWRAITGATPLGPALADHPKEHARNVKRDVFRQFRGLERRGGKYLMPTEAVLAVGRK
jgi:SAM-dependent methyltransferase